MEESESGINLQELSNDDQDEANKRETKEKEDKEKQGTFIPANDTDEEFENIGFFNTAI